ncbi:hypothetical protein D3C71_2020650 [compost metagenome]
MNKQIPEFDICIAHIRTKNVLTKKVEELTSCRVLPEKGTMLMTRAGEGAVVHRHILAQGVKKGGSKFSS